MGMKVKRQSVPWSMVCQYDEKMHYNESKAGKSGIIRLLQVSIFQCYASLPWHCLYFFPLPQGQGSLRPTLGTALTTGCNLADSEFAVGASSSSGASSALKSACW
jgi:hypothetical protein